MISKYSVKRPYTVLVAVVLVIVAALAIVGLCTWYHFSIEPLGNGYAAYAFWR